MTGIEWVRNPDGSRGVTLNSKTGCLNHTPEGLCLGGLFPCYAYKLANARLKPLYLANDNWPQMILNAGKIKWPIGYHPSTDPFYPRWWPERLAQISKLKKPTGIFLDDMSDWMGDCWPREWTMAELQMMRENPQHRFYTLTKQAQRLPEFSPFPENCWVGVTVTSESMMQPAYEALDCIQAKVKYISFEPLISRLSEANIKLIAGAEYYKWLDWLIIGACTGNWQEMAQLCLRCKELTLTSWGNKWTAQPPIEWVREIVEAAGKAGVKVFLKDNLYPIFNVKTESDALKLHIKFPWAFSRTEFSGETDRIKYHGKMTALRQEMPNG